MEKKSDLNHPDRWLKDLPAKSEPQGFKPEEMATCEKCGRTSPPTRAACFYCGANLPASELQDKYLKLNLRKLEEWEKGFNVIFLPGEKKFDTTKLSEIAAFLKFENEDLQKIIEAEKPLPLARCESRVEAEIIAKRLAENEIESKIVGDEQLELETVTRRLRGIEIFDDIFVFILFNADEIAEIKFEDVALIVVGAFFERRIESIESIRRKAEKKVLDSSETGTDELLIDIYPKENLNGYRIESKGFDFSCLGAEKSLLARENMKKLAEMLRSLSPNAGFDNDYLRVRAELGKVWEVQEKTDAGGVNRPMLSGFKRTNITTINNLTQFTRYSRLQRHLL